VTFAKKILSTIGIALIATQFFRPALNKSFKVPDTDVSKMVSASDSVLLILRSACYDCHSNNTIYPWYCNVQPVGWLMAKHIIEGKKELNFSEFGSYSQRRQLSKLEGIANSIRDNIMPLKSYKIMHRPAQLSTHERSLLVNWAQQSIDSLPAIK
jgi:hypothetical protein